MIRTPRRARPPLAFPLRLPEDGLPARVGSAYLARLWDVDYRAINRWADLGLLETCRDGGWRYFYREAVEAFTRTATPVRALKPGMTVRHPKWTAGEPCRVVEVSMIDEQRWRIGYSTPDGRLAYTPPCPGELIVLHVPPRPGAS